MLVPTSSDLREKVLVIACLPLFSSSSHALILISLSVSKGFGKRPTSRSTGPLCQSCLLHRKENPQNQQQPQSVRNRHRVRKTNQPCVSPSSNCRLSSSLVRIRRVFISEVAHLLSQAAPLDMLLFSEVIHLPSLGAPPPPTSLTWVWWARPVPLSIITVSTAPRERSSARDQRFSFSL